MSRGETIRLSVGESVPLACEFYTAYFNLFDNPILWRKTQLHEDTQINMMGNLMEPFASEGRFQGHIRRRESKAQTHSHHIE